MNKKGFDGRRGGVIEELQPRTVSPNIPCHMVQVYSPYSFTNLSIAPVNDYEYEKYSSNQSRTRSGADGPPLFVEDRVGRRPGSSRDQSKEEPKDMSREDRSDRDRSDRGGDRRDSHRSSRDYDRDDRRRDRDDRHRTDRHSDRDYHHDRSDRSDRISREDRGYDDRRRKEQRSRSPGRSHYDRRGRDRPHERSYDQGRSYGPGSGSGWGSGGGGGRRRSPSPPRPFGGMSPERGPQVASLEGRLRHLQNWDAAPKGFELISADKAKLLGIFPPPGNVAKLTSFVPPVLDPALASMVAMLSGGDADSAITALLPSGLGGNSKSHRRLYVAGFPAEAAEDEISRFLNRTIASVTPSSTDAVLGVQISHDRNYAFVDFRTPEDASTLITFDGISWKDGISTIRIRRPREYNEGGTETAGPASVGVLGSISSFMAESDKIALVGLPKALREEHVSAMLELFGELRSCVLLCEPSGASTGTAVFEYRDEHLGQRVCEELNGLMMGATALSLRPVTEVTEDEPELLGTISCFNLAVGAASGEPTSVLLLLNMVSEDGPELREEYEEVSQDIMEEASKYGTVRTLEIPRPSGGLQPGVGKVFIEYENEHEAQAALEALSGRVFADRTVVGFFYSPTRFHAHLY